jgi:hypothetical protein
MLSAESSQFYKRFDSKIITPKNSVTIELKKFKEFKQ